MIEKSGRGWWRLFAIALMAVQVPVLLKAGADPQQSDFANYFTPAHVLATGGDLAALYDRDAFDLAMADAGIVGLGSFTPQPPANALWLLPLANLPPSVAKTVWTALLLIAIGLSVLAVHRLSIGLSLPLAVVVVLAPTLAIRNGLAFGQPYLILAAFLLFGTLALERGRRFLAGLLLGLGVSFKPYALVLGILFIHRDRRRELAGFVIGAVVPSFLLWMLTGPAPFVEFARKIVPWMVRGDIQDPFAPGWGSAMALTNRLLRYEPDLNPSPWFEAPHLARFMSSALAATLLVLGTLAGRSALREGRRLDAIGLSIAFAVTASPLVASYHLALLVVPALAMVVRLDGRGRELWLLGWAVLGSSLVNVFRSATGGLAPLAYLRFFGVLTLSLVVAWPFVTRRMLTAAIVIGPVLGFLTFPGRLKEEAWQRIESARGYSMVRPYFCDAELRWWSPSADGRRLETHGPGKDCRVEPGPRKAAGGEKEGPRVISRFSDRSWNLFLQLSARGAETQLTSSDANEIDPVLTPDGCALVFASDQGRGLGSTALYRLDLSTFIDGCGRSSPASPPR